MNDNRKATMTFDQLIDRLVVSALEEISSYLDGALPEEGSMEEDQMINTIREFYATLLGGEEERVAG